MRVRGEVEVGEVVREEVEAVARDEPAPDCGGVHVDRAAGAVAHGERRARRVGLEEAVVEEALRAVRRLRHPRQRRLVPRAAAVARDVHRCGHEPGVLERLVDGDRVLREVLLVHVEDRVGERLRHARGAQRGERRAVLDDAPLLAVPPDEMRDVVHVGPGAGRDRREADGRERREDRRRAAVRALLGEQRERGRAAAVDGALERGGRHAVDDDEDELLGAHFASVRRPAYRSGARRRRRAGERRQRERLEIADDRHEGERRRRRARRPRRALPCRRRVPPRRSAPRTITAAPSAPASAAERAADPVDEAAGLPGVDREPETEPDRSRDDDRERDDARREAGDEHAGGGSEADADADPVPGTHPRLRVPGACKTKRAARASISPGRKAIGSGEHLAADRLQADTCTKQAGRDTLDHAPLPDRGLVEPRPGCEHARPLTEVAFERVLAHDDPEIVFGRREQAVGVDELEAVASFECVPLMDVTVDQHGGLVSVRCAATRRARERVLEGPLAARVVELLPHRRDEVREPLRLPGARRQAALRRRPPHALRSGDEDLVPALEREIQLGERPPQALEQERAARDVVPQQPHAASAGCETEDGDLVRGRITVAWDDQLQHGGRTVAAGRFGDERFRGAGVHGADRELPFLLEGVQEIRERLEPRFGAGR